jgi:polysaccharide biosynthesis protein PslH
VKILVLTSRFPYPLEKGDKLRIFHQIRELSRYHEIVLCSLAENPVQELDYQEVKQYCSKIFIFQLRTVSIIKNIIANIFSLPNGISSAKKIPFQVAYFFDSHLKKMIHKTIATEKPDHIYCQLARMAEFVRDIPIPKTLDYMDAFSKGAERRAESSNCLTQPFWRLEARRMGQYETDLAQDFDNLTVISEQDRNLFSPKNNPKIQVVPNGVDTNFFKNIAPFAPVNAETKAFHIAFVGNLGYYPNVEAVKFLVKRILPLLKKQIPNIKVLIAGARPTTEVKALADENVRIQGWLPDIREAYTDAQLFVAPLFHGSGQQNKILEAMAMGVPCVTTTLVNNAILAQPDEEILIADTPQEFAKKILQMLTESPQSSLNYDYLRVNARQFVEKNYSWGKATFTLKQLLESQIVGTNTLK